MFSEIFEKFTENPVFAQSFLAQEKKPGLSGAARARWWGCRGLPRIKLCRVLDGLGLTHCAEYQAPNVLARVPSSPPNTLGEDDVTSKNQPPLEGVTTLGKSAQGRDNANDLVSLAAIMPGRQHNPLRTTASLDN